MSILSKCLRQHFPDLLKMPFPELSRRPFTTKCHYVDESTSILAMWWTFVGMSRQKAHIPLCSMLNVLTVQSKCNVSVVIPWVELRSYSATPTVDGDRGDPIPDQAYIEKKSQIPFISPRDSITPPIA